MFRTRIRTASAGSRPVGPKSLTGAHARASTTVDVGRPLAGAAASRARAVARAALRSLTREKVPVLVSSRDQVPVTPRRPFFTPRSLAAYLAISGRSMREMLREGRMPSYKIEGARRIDATDVDRYLAAHRE